MKKSAEQSGLWTDSFVRICLVNFFIFVKTATFQPCQCFSPVTGEMQEPHREVRTHGQDTAERHEGERERKSGCLPAIAQKKAGKSSVYNKNQYLCSAFMVRLPGDARGNRVRFPDSPAAVIPRGNACLYKATGILEPTPGRKDKPGKVRIPATVP